jgi:hypothetical protein
VSTPPKPPPLPKRESPLSDPIAGVQTFVDAEDVIVRHECAYCQAPFDAEDFDLAFDHVSFCIAAPDALPDTIPDRPRTR